MKNSTALTGTVLTFRRGADEIRPFEVAALNAVPGIGSYYPDLTTLGVEAQMLRSGPVTEGTVSVFFKLISFDNLENIEIQDPLLPGIYVNKGFIWASSDGTANATITKDVVNGHKAIESLIDGDVVRFEFDPDFGFYLPVEEVARGKAMKIASQRGSLKAA